MIKIFNHDSCTCYCGLNLIPCILGTLAVLFSTVASRTCNYAVHSEIVRFNSTELDNLLNGTNNTINSAYSSIVGNTEYDMRTYLGIWKYQSRQPYNALAPDLRYNECVSYPPAFEFESESIFTLDTFWKVAQVGSLLSCALGGFATISFFFSFYDFFYKIRALIPGLGCLYLIASLSDACMVLIYFSSTLCKNSSLLSLQESIFDGIPISSISEDNYSIISECTLSTGAYLNLVSTSLWLLSAVVCFSIPCTAGYCVYSCKRINARKEKSHDQILAEQNAGLVTTRHNKNASRNPLFSWQIDNDGGQGTSETLNSSYEDGNLADLPNVGDVEANAMWDKLTLSNFKIEDEHGKGSTRSHVELREAPKSTGNILAVSSSLTDDGHYGTKDKV